MKIYLIEQYVMVGYDTYDSLVCIAENENEAKLISPYYPQPLNKKKTMRKFGSREICSDSWVSMEEIDKIKVTYLGEAKEGSEKGVVLASFNAG